MKIISVLKSIFKNKYFFPAFSILLAAFCGFLFWLWQNSITQNQRLNTIVYQKTVQFDDINGRHVTETSEMQMTIDELKERAENGDSLAKLLIRENGLMKIKLSKTESLGFISFISKDSFNVIPVYDTCSYFSDLAGLDSNYHPYNEREEYSDNCFEYTRTKSSWQDTAKITMTYQDSLIWSVSWYKYPEKWKLKNIFIWRDKFYKLDAKFLCQNTVIRYAAYIRTGGKRK